MSSKIYIARDNELIDESPVFPPEKTGSEFPAFIRNSARAHRFAVTDIDYIAVDIGPGRLSATRSGVSFANALSFSLSRPIIPLSYFELVTYEIALKTSSPIIGVVESSNGMGYVSYSRDGLVTSTKYGNILDELSITTTTFDTYCLAGQFSSDLPRRLALPPHQIYSECIPGGHSMLHCSLRSVTEGHATTDPVQAITEPHGAPL